MTYMDKVHAKFEEQAREATHSLLLWLGTIAPVGGPLSVALTRELLALAKEMGWPVETDENAITLLKKMGPPVPQVLREDYKAGFKAGMQWEADNRILSDDAPQS